MTKDEFITKLTTIGTSQDEAERRTLITELTDDAVSIFDANETLTQANSKYAEDNKKLQEHNMRLFLKVSDQSKPTPQVEEPKPTENLKYENLFNDKGELK